MATPDLLRLPQELIIRISTFLNTAELGLFRRSCKQVETSLFESFAKEFFTKRQFMVEQVSLQALVDIANHPTLSSRLKEVIVSSHAFAPDPDLWERLQLAGYIDREILIATGQAHSMLKEAFSKLPNLQTIGLRDYDGTGRQRDGPDARWRSYGWSLSPTRRLKQCTPVPLLPLLISAISISGAMPTNLEVFLRREQQLTPDSFDLPRTGPVAHAINLSLERLTTVMLAVTLQYHAPADITFGSPRQPYNERNIYEMSLRRFLHLTPNLKCLRLNFCPHEFFAPRFLDWLGRDSKGSSTDAISEPLALPIPTTKLANLSRLDIGMANAPGTTLIKVLTKCNLEAFSLWKIALQTADKAENAWSKFLEELAVQLPLSSTLRSVMIGYVTQLRIPPSDARYRRPIAVMFIPMQCSIADAASAATAAVVKYEGQFTALSPHQWLEELAKRSRLQEARSPSLNDSDSDAQSIESMDIDDEEDIDVDEDEDAEEGS